MATSYEVSVRFWNDDKVRAQHPDGKLTMLYLMTCRQANGLGIYVLHPEVGARETGLPLRRFRCALDGLQRAGMVRFDARRNVVWLVNRARHVYRKGVSEPQAKGIVRCLDDLPSESETLREFTEHYKGFLEGLPEGLGKGFMEAIRARLSLPSVLSLIHSPIPESLDMGASAPDPVQTFSAFWNEYPRKVRKAEALAVWCKLDPPLEACLKALKIAKQSRQWHNEGGRYIPWAVNWLKQKRWDDEGEEEREQARSDEWRLPDENIPRMARDQVKAMVDKIAGMGKKKEGK